MPSRVALGPCADYGKVAAALPRLLAPLGGMAAFVRPGQNVLIKPNLLSDREPDLAVTTHPAVVRELIRLVRDCGATPAVGDCPSNAVKLEAVWERTGMAALCREENVALLNLEKAGSQPLESGGMRFTVARPVLDADVLINVPKVKTHMLTTLTAAVKNLYGVIPGFQKTSLHKLYPRPDQFGALLAAVAERVPAALTVADAIVGMEGNGPSAGTPVRLGFLAAAADPAALDAVLCRVLRIPPRRVHYLGALARRRHGRGDWADVETVGAAPAAVAPRAFRLPRVPPLGLVPMGLVRLVQPLVWTRPRFTERCTACGQCVRQCPTEALRQEAGEWPVLDPGRCIECCCCHEICPARAVVMEPSPLLRLVRGGKRP